MHVKRIWQGDKVVGLQLLHTGTSQKQNFSRRFVLTGIANGWLSLDEAKITIRCENETLDFDVLRTPGYYCVSTGQRIPISQLAWEEAVTRTQAHAAPAEARAWLAGAGKGERDFEACHAYECVLDAKQHQKWKAEPNVAMQPVAAWLAQQQRDTLAKSRSKHAQKVGA